MMNIPTHTLTGHIRFAKHDRFLFLFKPEDLLASVVEEDDLRWKEAFGPKRKSIEALILNGDMENWDGFDGFFYMGMGTHRHTYILKDKSTFMWDDGNRPVPAMHLEGRAASVVFRMYARERGLHNYAEKRIVAEAQTVRLL